MSINTCNKSNGMRFLIITLLLFMAFAAIAYAKPVDVYFFYGDGCPHCAKVEPYIAELKNNPNVNVVSYEIYNNKDNAKLLTEYFNNYTVPARDQGIPAVFIGNSYLVGDKPIIDNLNMMVEKAITENSNTTNTTGISGSSSPTEPLKTVSFATIAGAALVDSINPCAIAVLIILLTSLIIAGDSKRALKAGFAFILSIYIVYFLFGVGLLALFTETMFVWGPVSHIIKILVGIFAIVIGLMNIKDFFWYGKVFLTEIPIKWRPKLKRMIEKVTSPIGAFFIGFIVASFELPCTGGPYLFVIGYLAKKVTYTTIIPILLLYNLIFVLPLIVLCILIYKGVTSTERANRWKERNLRPLHLVAGLIMLVLGILVVLGII